MNEILQHNGTYVPQWSRISKFNRRLPRDKSRPSTSEYSEISNSDASQEDGSDGYRPSRVTQLEKNIILLRNQHSDSLHSVYSELDRLKRENQSLNFQLTLKDTSIHSKPAAITRVSEDNQSNKAFAGKNSLIAQQISDYQKIVAKYQSQNEHLRNVLEEQNELLLERRRREELEIEYAAMDDSSEFDLGSVRVLFDPLRIVHRVTKALNTDTEQCSTEPELKDCFAVIKEIYKINTRQQNEITSLVNDNRDLQYRNLGRPPVSHSIDNRVPSISNDNRLKNNPTTLFTKRSEQLVAKRKPSQLPPLKLTTGEISSDKDDSSNSRRYSQGSS